MPALLFARIRFNGVPPETEPVDQEPAFRSLDVDGLCTTESFGPLGRPFRAAAIFFSFPADREPSCQSPDWST